MSASWRLAGRRRTRAARGVSAPRTTADDARTTFRKASRWSKKNIPHINKMPKAVVVLTGTAGVSGTVNFEETADGEQGNARRILLSLHCWNASLAM